MKKGIFIIVAIMLISSFFLTASTFNYNSDDEISISAPVNFRSVESKPTEDQRPPKCWHHIRNCNC